MNRQATLDRSQRVTIAALACVPLAALLVGWLRSAALWVLAWTLGIAAVGAFACLSGCASGPQVVPVTPITNLTVNVYAYDGGAIRFGELWIDGTSSDGQAEAQGLDVDAETDVSVETDVSAVP